MRWENTVLIADFLGNICANIYRHRTVYVKIIASQRWDVFETQCNDLFQRVVGHNPSATEDLCVARRKGLHRAWDLAAATHYK